MIECPWIIADGRECQEKMGEYLNLIVRASLRARALLAICLIYANFTTDGWFIDKAHCRLHYEEG